MREWVAVVRVDHENKKTNYVLSCCFGFLFCSTAGQQQLSLSFFFLLIILFVRLVGQTVGPFMSGLSSGLGRPIRLLLWLSRLYTNQNTRTRQTDSSPHSCCCRIVFVHASIIVPG